MRILYTLAFFSIFCASNAQSIDRFSIDSGGTSTSAGGIQIVYTIGEVHVAERTSATLSLSEGFIVPQSVSIRVNPIVFLQGPGTDPFAGELGLMRDNLRSADPVLIPTTSPYDSSICDASVFSVTGENAIVDWVFVELRDATDPSVIVASQSALLQRDGDVVSSDGSTSLQFSIPESSYYIAITHRNHLGILSANPVALDNTTTMVDMTQNLSSISGGSLAVVQLTNGQYALIAGDVTPDGQILTTDYLNSLPSIGLSGYLTTDVNMDGQVLNTDILLLTLPNVGRSQQY
ncbi:hemagglutinin protein [uncultured Dokdonia sp.]|uniref:hemagglutinin protein n=1 Tax=uncultured Dokdonia sp. TaxID=575653 RepID=UPI00262D7AC9|nr:hemagglutinin protein [uncultured Dokdonia sp.]